MSERIQQMFKTWQSERRAFSHLENDDSNFFEIIGKFHSEVGITSQTGCDLMYHLTSYRRLKPPHRKLKKSFLNL
jgi:hypothetical protein